MFLNNKVYDTLKWIAQYALPGVATLYFAVSNIWGLPHTEQIVGSIVAFNVFVGALLGLSAIQYNAIQKRENKVRSDYEAQTFSYPANDPVPTPPFSMKPEVYAVVKWFSLIFLPAAGTFYFALSGFWGFPYGEQIVGTIAALTIFMGIVLGVSTNQFNKALTASSS